MTARPCRIALYFMLTGLTASAGTIVGHVSARGKELPGGSAGGAYQSKKFKFLEKVDYDEVKDFIVYVEAPYDPEFARKLKPAHVVVQENAMFSPHVMAVLVGTKVDWPNEDDIYHNVFSMSGTKEFDLDLYKAPVVKSVVFDKPGRVDVFCSIHKNMNCIILVLENPWFASTDADGNYSIPEVPPGTYTVKAWHERLPAQTRELVVPAEGNVTADFVLGIKGLPTY